METELGLFFVNFLYGSYTHSVVSEERRKMTLANKVTNSLACFQTNCCLRFVQQFRCMKTAAEHTYVITDCSLTSIYCDPH